MHSKVLVLDGHEFSTLAIVRSLGRQRLTVTIGCEADSPHPISNNSRFASELYLYPNPITQADEFVDHIIEFLSQNSFDLIIPVTEKTSLLLAPHRDRIEQFTRLALPDYAILELASDKSQTFAIANEENIPVPYSIYIHQPDELIKVAPTLTYPIVIKPSRTVVDAKNDVRVKLTVQYAFNAEELLKKGLSVLNYAPLILQEYFSGDGVGVEVLANQGEIILAFQHQRLHEMPLTGGGSCLRKSVPINPQLLDYAKRLIKRLNWHGVAMLEFKHNADTQQSRLMEINGRFWGSLPLAVDAGADFPYALYRLLVLNDTNPTMTTHIGRVNRKLQDDLYWLLIVLFRRDNNPLIKWPSSRQVAQDYLSVLSPKHRFDSFSYDDPKPFAIDILRTINWFYHLAQQFIVQRYWQAIFSRHKKTGTVNQPLKTARNILFICYGNINRSVLAQKCLRHHLGDSIQCTINSSGFHPKANRPADPVMVQIAASNGIDLSQWSSHYISKESADQADLIFVMEIAHFQRLIALYPACKSKTFLLGSVIADPEQLPLDIADPFGQSPALYKRCFNHINVATEAIAASINHAY